MPRRGTALVLGYHGTSRDTRDAVLSGKSELSPSRNTNDWLGRGVYFWEDDPLRAQVWAERSRLKSVRQAPAVVGAIIDLGTCLDLGNAADLQIVRAAYETYAARCEALEVPLLKNRDAQGDPIGDLLHRNLDCAVINEVHAITAEAGSGLEPFDTVRGVFLEGAELYPGAGFRSKTHTQIAVLNPACILGYFRPRTVS
jgi:hypothetical protein